MGGLAAAAWAWRPAHAQNLAGPRRNVLLITIDDLRPELGCYGRSHIHSPHIDRLAARGWRFDRAYCQSPVCGASRCSLLTGLRPTWDRFFTWDCRKDTDAPDAVSLPMAFKHADYTTASVGKVYHHADDDRDAWTHLDLGYAGQPWRYLTPEAEQQIRQRLESGDGRSRGPAYEAADAPDGAFPDGEIAQRACEHLTRLGNAQAPFFLAVGFTKPHLPFNCPKRYWDLYDPQRITPPDPHPPRETPAQALTNYAELRSYLGIPGKGPIDEPLARTLIHGYYACTSFVDAQVGRVLDQLHRLGLEQDTLVVLLGDHGWNLGDHGLWCKHVNFETTLRCPLILAGPDLPAGKSSAQLVELLDLYPTLAQHAGIKAPNNLPGQNLAPLFTQPDTPIKSATFSRYYHGQSVGTLEHRYTAWQEQAHGPVVAETLFDLQRDPGETENLAEHPEHQRLKQHLRTQMAG